VTEDEIRGLLAAAMAYDNRRPGDANVAAWLEAATRARWTFPAALDAVHAHYATATQFLMPGHVTERIRQDRREPAPAAGLLGPSDPASDDTRSTVMDQIRGFAGRFGLPREVKRAGRRARDAAAREQARRELDAIRDQHPDGPS
jgi:hypothetical protein